MSVKPVHRHPRGDLQPKDKRRQESAKQPWETVAHVAALGCRESGRRMARQTHGWPSWIRRYGCRSSGVERSWVGVRLGGSIELAWISRQARTFKWV